MKALSALLFVVLSSSLTAAAPPQGQQVAPKEDNPAAQTQVPGDTPGARKHPDKPGPGVDTSEVHVRAETQGGDASHYVFRGFVDLVAGELRIQSDQMDLYTTDKPDGTKAHRVVADGNVVFMKDEERLSGAHLDMDIDTGKGFLDDAQGYVEPGVFVEGRRIERVEERLYHVEGGKFTSCAQPNPRWTISASSATIEVDEKIIAHNAVFKVKSVPALYFPLLYYPIDRSGRSTGFLIPQIGHSSYRGFAIGEGFFWAMSRSTDMTFYGDSYSKYGYGFGHEFRYALSRGSHGTFRTYLFWPNGGDREYELTWNAAQTLPGGIRAGLQIKTYTSQSFNQRFNDSFNNATSRSKRGSLNLQKSFGSTTVQLLADSFDTYFGQEDFRVNRRLPSLQIRQAPRKIKKTGLVFNYEASAERLTLGDQDLVQSYSRFDLGPELSRPLQVSFLQLTPKASLRYTRWSSSAGGEGVFDGPALERKIFAGSLDMRGPTFSKVFDVDLGSYTNRIKHTIGPEVNFVYRTAVDDFLAIPKFDGNDYLLGTNQVTYALVQRLLAKRPSPSGKLVPYEFLNWRIFQTYYVQIGNNQNSFDPNYSSSAYGPLGVPDHNSPVASRMRIRLTPALSLDLNHEYDVNFKQLRTQGYSLRAGTQAFALQGTWSRSAKLSLITEERVPVRNTLRVAAQAEILKDRLTLQGSTDYDFITKALLQAHIKADWTVQCCGVSVEYIEYNYNARVEHLWRFSVHLANIGDTTNFLGIDDQAGRPGGISAFR